MWSDSIKCKEMDKKSQAHMTKELLRWKLKLYDIFYVSRFAMLICIMVNNGSTSCNHGQYMHTCVEDFH